ncbi:hypothetical protein REPUB_Repub05bG0060000 [Reevesia pubescens]
MVEDLSHLWSKLSLTEAEQEEVLVDNEWVVETVQQSVHCLVGKLMTRKSVNVEAMNTVLSRVWKVQIHGLPLGLMNEKMGIVMGESLGDIEELRLMSINLLKDHHEMECDLAVEMRMKYGSIVREYGAWMRAEGKLVRLGKDDGAVDNTLNMHRNSAMQKSMSESTVHKDER